MKKSSINKFLYACLSLYLIMASSCQKEMINLVELPKDVNGSWKIVKLIRGNEDMTSNEDLTSKIDLSNFKIIFNTDNTYTLQGQFPFIVSNAGTFSLDDPQYPFNISFQEQNSTTKTSLSFSYPIVGDQQQIILKLSPGCTNNTYEYTFEKVQ